MSRARQLLVVAIVCVVAATAAGGLFVGAVGPAAADGPVVVSNVTISPDTPTPGEPVAITVALENPADSGGSFDVGSVALRSPSGKSLTEYTRVEKLGTLDSGSRVEVPLYRTFDSTGTYRMRVVVFSDDLSSAIEYPVVVEVKDPSAAEPELDVDTGSVVENTESRLNVTLANSLQNDILGAEVTLQGDGLAVEDDRKVLGSMERGSDATLGFEITPTRADDVTATATVNYTTDEGAETATERFELDVEAANPSLAVDARSVTRNGSSAIEVDLANHGNVPVSDLQFETSSNASVSKPLVDTVDPGESRTVELRVDSVNGTGEVTVPLTASYTAAGERLTTETRVDVAANPGSIQLTGVRIEPQGSKLHVSGSTSNVGLSEANAVLVEVVDTPNVTPANPNRDYFVGAVPANEFVTFDVYATVSGRTSSLPLRVEYIVGGERHSRLVEVPVSTGTPGGRGPAGPDSGAAPEGESDGPEPPSSSGLGVGPIAFGGAVVLAIGSAIGRGWRRSRDRD